MRRSNFALRVPPTLLAEARKAAESEGVALNQLITFGTFEGEDRLPYNDKRRLNNHLWI
jgi:HicB family